VIRIGTSEHGGTFYGQGFALKTVLERDPNLAPVSVLETLQASIENANRLEAGEIELGFIATNWVGRARRGEPPFARPIDLRIVAPMNAGPLFFIVRADSKLRTVADLAGKRVVFGLATSGMTQHAKTMFGTLGLAVEAIHLDFSAGGEAVASGAADAQLQCPIPNPVMTALSEHFALRVLPWETALLERLTAQVPFYRPTVMRKGAFRGLDVDVTQPAVLNLLATHARVNPETVAAVTRAIAAGAAELARLNPLFDGLDALLAQWRAGALPA
jgi:TRAP transporter TAXI family solute receptor